MQGDIIGIVMLVVTLVVVALAVFFLVVGLWQGLLKGFVVEAQSIKEHSGLKALRQVVLARLAGFNRSFMPPKYEQRINRRILTAGGLDGLAAEEFLALQELACVGFTLFAVVLINFLNDNMAMDMSWFWLVVFAILGLFYPEIWLRDQVKNRHNQIIRDLPYNLDLMTLAVEAGLDFQAAVGTVVEKGKKGPLSEELSVMIRMLRMGKTREESLRAMGERVNLPQLSSFVAALVQADRMGTSLGKVLRIQSSQLRTERTQRAEKAAAEAPVKMLLPLIACIFPTVFMILFGPILYQLLSGSL